MTFENMTLEEAHNYVYKRRTFVRPNFGFWKQLIEYEKELKGANTVTMVSSGTGMKVYITYY